MYKSTNHHKKLTDLKKPNKAQRGTVDCNNCALSHILFSIYFLPFTFLTLFFIFAAVTSACLRLCANKWKQRPKNETRINNLNVDRKMRTESDWGENYCKEQSLSMCLILLFFPSVTSLCDILVTFTKSLLLLTLPILVPWVSGWFWQTMFLFASKINWRGKSLPLTVRQGVQDLYKSQNHHKV